MNKTKFTYNQITGEAERKMLDKGKISAYNAILKEELLVATGCTEPIAIAFCAATLRDIMGRAPEKLDIPVVMGTVIIVSIIVAAINLIIDIIYAFIDPRVKVGYEG